MHSERRFLRLSAAFALVTVMTVCLAVSALAQLNTSKIEGVVRDKDNGQPLIGAQVTVEGTRLGNITNKDGYYFILNVPPGRRSITFSYTGYQKTTISEQLLLAGQTTTLNADLSSTVVELSGITVEAENEPLVPRDNTVSKQRLTAERISDIPASKLEDMMVLEAGVQTGGSGALSRGVRIRGGRLGEEAMVVDGVTVRNYTANPFRSGQGWVFEQEKGSLSEDTTPLEFSTESVEQVDILTGGFQAEYGNAQSGIINIVTKEGGPDLRGSVRFITDQQNPRTSDYGYNQLMTSVGGPVPLIPNLFFNVSGELQGLADRTPTHADEGFRGVNQDFVDHLNDAVRNDPHYYGMTPFSLDEFKTGRQFYASKTGALASLFSPENPVRLPYNWQDRHLVTTKLTMSPFEGLKLIGTSNFSRTQNSYPAHDDGNYFFTGEASISRLPDRDWTAYGSDTTVFIPQAYGRRTRSINYLAGFDWDFLKSAKQSATLQFRFTNFRTQDINSSSIKDNYRHDNTFLGWTPHDIPFEIETFPGRNYPMENTETAHRYFPNGRDGWERNWSVETPLSMIFGDWLYFLNYRYQRERQYNYKADLDFQFNRMNRAKLGVQFTNFNNDMYDIRGANVRRDLNNEFQYKPRQLALYLQNRTDLGDFVIDYGIRYDEFQPRSNWGFRNYDQYGENFFPKNVSEWSPRFDVAFPVTDKAQMRFSYGVFTQLPSMTFIFSGSNPGGLEYSRTDAFESGLSYLLGADQVLDIVAFYRDVDGDVASKQFFRDYYAWHLQRRIREYSTGYTNRDNGNIKGLDFTLRRRFSSNFSYNLMYTLQFSRTTGSDYASTSSWGQYIDPSTGEDFRPPDEIRPIDGDQTHKLSTDFIYMFPEDFRSGTLANKILKNTRINTIFTLASGTPYNSNRDGRPIGGVNYFRGRWNKNIDLRVTKSLSLSGVKRFSVSADIFNVLNQKPSVSYPSSYKYDDYYYRWNGGQELKWSDGMLANNDAAWSDRVMFNSDFNGDGIMSLEEQAKGAMAAAMMSSTMEKTQYGRPRQVRMGVEFSF